jgi:long-subunit acyl-CoA synthetase (AMP-forming)
MQLCGLKQRLLSHPRCTVWEYRGGVRHEVTFPGLAADVDRAVERLRAAGTRAGMRVGVLAANRYEWVVFDLALIELRCVTVALVDEVVTDGLEAAADRFRLHLVVTDRRPEPKPAWVLPIEPSPGRAEARTSLPIEEDPGFDTPAWVFSSGSSGRVKAITTRRQGVEALVENLPRAFELRTDDRFLMFLPMSSFQQRFLLYGCLWNGVNLIITEPRFLFGALKHLSPTILLAPPAFFEAIITRVRNASPPRRWLLGAVTGLSGWLPSARLRGLLAAAVSRPLRTTLGGRVRLMITGMAPVKAGTLAFFDRLGMPLYEVYGMTECGMIAWNTLAARRVGSVGQPLADAEVTIAPDGEVVVKRSAQPTSGYLFEPSDEDERQTYLDPDTVATGDVGRFDTDGFLYLLGRKKNVIVTSGGAKIHPEVIEGRINRCPDVERSVVFGTDEDFLAAVVVPAVDSPESRRRIQAHVDAVNGNLPAGSCVGRVVFSPHLTREDGMLTANLKLDRKAIAARFGSALFGTPV